MPRIHAFESSCVVPNVANAMCFGANVKLQLTCSHRVVCKACDVSALHSVSPVPCVCRVHHILRQHSLQQRTTSSPENANGETVLNIGALDTSRAVPYKPSLLKRLASKTGFVTDSAHGEPDETPHDAGLSGHSNVAVPADQPLDSSIEQGDQPDDESGIMLTGSQSHEAASPADGVMLPAAQLHEAESATGLPGGTPGGAHALPAPSNAQHTAAKSHKASSRHKGRESSHSHAPGRLDRDIAYMLWGTHRQARQLKHVVPLHSDPNQPDHTDEALSSNMQLPETETGGQPGRAEGRLSGAGGSLTKAETALQRGERSSSEAVAVGAGTKGSTHGAEGTMYTEDAVSEEAQEAAGTSSRSKAANTQDRQLPDEVLVEQAQRWAGRYGSSI